MNALDGIQVILERHVSPLIARSIVDRALRHHNLTRERFGVGDAHKIRPLLEQGLRLFAAEGDRDRALRELAAVVPEGGRGLAGPRRIRVATESDISLARSEARQLCEELGAGSYAVQKITTIVSELARNIVSYAGSGTLELLPVNDVGRRIVLRAADSGPGIPHLEQVLAGRYRSKTGLGRGLLGTKRLADKFGVATGTSGTTVVAEVGL